MFDNIGSKIKSWAKVVCWVGILVSVIVGIPLFEESPLGLLIMIIGSLSSWIGSFFAYGFGELIEKTTEIAENTRPNHSDSTNISDN